MGSADDLAKWFGPNFGERNKAKFIDDVELIGGELFLKPAEAFLITRSINPWTSAAPVVKPTESPFWQAGTPQAQGKEGFACTTAAGG